MARRLELHSELVNLLGSQHVYFQPPETVKLNYPCFIYHLTDMDTKYADDKIYTFRDAYEIMYITRKADDDMREKVIRHFELCRPGRPYTADNLYHQIFTLYY